MDGFGSYREAISDAVSSIGGVFTPNISGMKEPAFVTGTDGVGSKLKIAFLMNKHDTVGIDCVAQCVNDVICKGAKPLVFLDYLAVGKNHPEKVDEIISGVESGCVKAGCTFIGGKKAEMPDFYANDEYNLAGFCVGVVDKEKLIDGSRTVSGDVIIGMASSGLHSNGFSLARHVLRINDDKLRLVIDDLGRPLGQELLEPTKIYVNPILDLTSKLDVHGIANITGGGFYGNIPHALSEGTKAVIRKSDVKVLPVFNIIQSIGRLEEREMFGTFNMGVGMAVTVAAQDADRALEILNSAGERAYIIGEVAQGEKTVDII